MDYQKLKVEIKEISHIAASVPEPFREKCFEILLQRALASEPVHKQKVEHPSTNSDADPASRTKVSGDNVQVSSHVKAFMRRRGVTQEQINALVMVDGDDVHFLREPSHGEARRGQNEWALLVALKTGLLHNSLKVDPEEVRSMVQEKGYYDSGNFSSNFKKPKYRDYFKEVLEGQGNAQGLSPTGEQALAELINQLIG